MNQNCRNCHSIKTVNFSLYRHRWQYCTDCKTAFSEKKKSLSFWMYFLPKKMHDYRQMLGLNKKGVIYDHYLLEHRRQTVIKLAHESHIPRFQKEFGIDFKGKKVLDLSGGNASYLLQFKDYGVSKIVFTEFSPNLVEYAKSLGIEAYVYDINGGIPLDTIVKDEFDVIIFKGNAMFTINPDEFFQSIGRCLTKEGVFLNLDSHIFTEALAVRWCHHHYTHLVCWGRDVMKDIQNRNGFDIVYEQEHTDGNYFEGLGK